MKQARRHYGFDVASPFREGRDPEEMSFMNQFTQQKECRNRMIWVIAKVGVFKELAAIEPSALLIACKFRERRCSKTLSEPQVYLHSTSPVNLGAKASNYIHVHQTMPLNIVLIQVRCSIYSFFSILD